MNLRTGRDKLAHHLIQLGIVNGLFAQIHGEHTAADIHANDAGDHSLT